MADINALYEELTKFYFNKGPSAQLNGPAGAWRALEFSEFFVPGGAVCVFFWISPAVKSAGI